MEYVQNGKEYVPDKLFASIKIPTKTVGIKLNGGQGILARGSVISLDTTKKGNLADKSKTSDNLYGVLADDAITGESASDYVVAEVYLTGDFNADALVFAAGTTLADYETKLRELGIYTGAVMEG